MSLSRPTSRQRDPPPALFLHPSPSASHASLPGIPPPGLPFPQFPGIAGPRDRPGMERSGSVRSGTVISPDGQRRRLQTVGSSRSADRTDTLWAQMQATLEDVELSASGGTHVFGPDHDRKLADLRAAQIALAQAWARSEADDAIETSDQLRASTAGDEVRNLKGKLGETTKASAVDANEGAKSTATSRPTSRPTSSGGGVERLGAELEQETEVDILHARNRREANDRYFQRVNQGVIDVVTKLEDVAVAMRAVEQESRDVWSESEASPGVGKAQYVSF